MKKLNNSNFELIEDVIRGLKIEYSAKKVEVQNYVEEAWQEICGNKTLQYAKVLEISADNMIIISCADSFVANELYLRKDKLLNNLREKLAKQGIQIIDIKFDYKRWK